jgi:hypothetical protein
MQEIMLPASIKVGGLDYTVQYSPEMDKELRGGECFGDHNYWLQRIRLRMDLQPQGLTQSFIHEILHAVDAVYLNKQLSENTIDPIAQGLTQVFEQLGIRFVLKGE